MSAIFPKWTNRLPLMVIIGALLTSTAVTAGVWYYFTPKYTRVGYSPIQPVAAGTSDSQNNRCEFAQRISPSTRVTVCSRWWWLFQ